MSWALHHTEPFELADSDVAGQVRAALVVANGATPDAGSDEHAAAIEAAASLVPHVATVGDPVYVTVTGHEGGGIKALTVSVSAGQRAEE